MTNKKIKTYDEFSLINLMQQQLKDPAKALGSKAMNVAVGIGDDAAVIDSCLKTKKILLATDMLVENVHFTSEMKPQDVGRKALAVNISDISAMGGVPRFALVSLGLSKKISSDAVKNIYQGLNKIASQFGVAIVGGDTTKSQNLVINVALMGEAESKHIVLRSGAKPGDQIFVTGKLGGSFTSGRHLKFTPRIKESQYLVQNYKINAMMDVSDGLASDLKHIVKQSNVGIVLDENQIPKHRGCTLKQAMTDGEDFELVFTLSPKEALRLEQTMKKEGFQFYKIGEVVAEPEVFFLRGQKGSLKKMSFQGYNHF